MNKIVKSVFKNSLNHPLALKSILLNAAMQIVVAGFFPITLFGAATIVVAGWIVIVALIFVLGTDWEEATLRISDQMDEVSRKLLFMRNKSGIVTPAIDDLWKVSELIAKNYDRQIKQKADRDIFEIGELILNLFELAIKDYYLVGLGKTDAVVRLTHKRSALRATAEALEWPADLAQKTRLRAHDRLSAAIEGLVETPEAAATRIFGTVEILKNLPAIDDKDVSNVFAELAKASEAIGKSIQTHPEFMSSQSTWELIDNDLPKIERVLSSYVRLSQNQNLTAPQKDELSKIRAEILELPKRIGQRLSKMNQRDIQDLALNSASLSS